MFTVTIEREPNQHDRLGHRVFGQTIDFPVPDLNEARRQILRLVPAADLVEPNNCELDNLGVRLRVELEGELVGIVSATHA